MKGHEKDFEWTFIFIKNIMSITEVKVREDISLLMCGVMVRVMRKMSPVDWLG